MRRLADELIAAHREPAHPRVGVVLLLVYLLLGLAILGLFTAAGAQAQPVVYVSTSGSVTTNGSDCTTSTNCVVMTQAARTSNGTIVVTGTWTGTLTFEGTLLDMTVAANQTASAGWFALNVLPNGSNSYVTTATANGQWIVPMALTGVRARGSAAMTGSASVAIAVTSARMNRVPGVDGTTLTPNVVCFNLANPDACLSRSAANTLKVSTDSTGTTAATSYAGKFTTTGTGTVTGLTLANGENVAALNGGQISFSTAGAVVGSVSPAVLSAYLGGALSFIGTSGSQSFQTDTITIAPASGSASFAALHLNPTINGTSSGTAYGLGVASKTNTLTGGTIKLASFGTTTSDLFTGYSELASISVGGQVNGTTFGTATNCANTGSPATCGSAAAGSVVIAAAATSVVVNTSAVTANSQIVAMIDRSLGTRLSVTCDTTSDLTTGSPAITARTAATSFTIAVPVAPAANPMCLSYVVVN